jgi:hypothetical protein
VNATQNLLHSIEKTGVTFFQNFTHLKPGPGYGLTVDHTGDLSLSSIASTGFYLSSLVIGVAQGYLSYDHALTQAMGTLKTLLSLPHYHGFIAHFIHIPTGERYKKCEYSTIDTALALNGVITVDSYFANAELSALASQLLDRVDWDILIHNRGDKKQFYMAYNPDADGDYVHGKPGYIHHWSMLAEQLMMYVFYAADTANPALAKTLYQDFERHQVTYHSSTYFGSPGNSLFVYQYPQCWFDLKKISDEQGVQWFENTRQAIYGHYWLSRDTVSKYPSFASSYFGFTASYGRKGYQVSGAIPNVNDEIHHDGSVAINAMIGSLYHAPELALPAIESLAKRPDLWDENYGFLNAFSDENPLWRSSRMLGIDKGLELLMTNAYLHQDVMKAYMAHPRIQKGMQVLGWKNVR